MTYHYGHHDSDIQFYIDNHVESTHGGCPTVLSLPYDQQRAHIYESHSKNLHLCHNNIIPILTNSHDQNITESMLEIYIMCVQANLHGVSELATPRLHQYIHTDAPSFIIYRKACWKYT